MYIAWAVVALAVAVEDDALKAGHAQERLDRKGAMYEYPQEHADGFASHELGRDDATHVGVDHKGMAHLLKEAKLIKTSAVWCALTATGVLQSNIRKYFAHLTFGAAARYCK